MVLPSTGDIKIAKCINSGQPARNAQADLVDTFCRCNEPV